MFAQNHPLLTALLASLLTNSAALADFSTNLIPNADTTLFQPFPDNNLGINVNTLSGNNAANLTNRALMRFDLTVLPANATVTAASLTMVVAKAAFGPDSNFGLHKMLVSWTEGSGKDNKGAPALSGETTWNNRFHPSTPWTSPGAVAGSDFAAAISGSTPIGSGTATIASTPALVADVQAWVSNPAANFGWILISDNETTAGTARRISSREDPGNEPVLTVTYTLPAGPTPPNIFNLAHIGNQLRFSFNGESGRSYTVETLTSLSTTNWSTLTNIPTLAADTTLQLTNTIAGLENYFRVRTP